MGQTEAEEGPMTSVWIYVDTSKPVGDAGHLKVFADPDTALSWFHRLFRGATLSAALAFASANPSTRDESDPT
jgi:hypothetical protein